MDDLIRQQLIERIRADYEVMDTAVIVGSEVYDARVPGSDIDVVVYSKQDKPFRIIYIEGKRVAITTLPPDKKHILWHGFLLPKRGLFDNVLWDYDLENIKSYIRFRCGIDRAWANGRTSNNKDIQDLLNEIRQT
jgi:hypothetical protein